MYKRQPRPGAAGLSNTLLRMRATTFGDPDEARTILPSRVSRCRLPGNVIRSALADPCLRGCINLGEGANLLAACTMPCVRFVDAVPPSLHHAGFGLCVGNAVAPAMFNGLADINATLGSCYWLGFTTLGLSPSKKRLAWLGAQRPGSPIPDAEQATKERSGIGVHPFVIFFWVSISKPA